MSSDSPMAETPVAGSPIGTDGQLAGSPHSQSGGKSKITEPDPKSEGGRSLGVIEKALGVATAVLVLLSTALGIMTKQSSDRNDSLTQSVASEKAANDALKRQISDLREQNSRLLQQSNALTSSGTSSGAASTPFDSVLRKSTAPVSLTRGQGIDFDTTAPDWGVTSIVTPDDDLQLRHTDYLNVNQLTGFSGPDLFVVDHVPTREDCTSTSATYQSALTPEETVPGTMMCVKTNRHHFASVKITKVGINKDSVALDILVWR